MNTDNENIAIMKKTDQNGFYDAINLFHDLQNRKYMQFANG